MNSEVSDEKAAAFGGIDVQAALVAISIFQAEDLEKAARNLLAKASEIRRSTRPVVRLELHDDGLISLQAWKGGLLNSSYPPLTLGSALREISFVVKELRELGAPASPEKTLIEPDADDDLKPFEPGVIYSEAEMRRLLGWRELLRRRLRRFLRWCGLSDRPDRDPQVVRSLRRAASAPHQQDQSLSNRCPFEPHNEACGRDDHK